MVRENIDLDVSYDYHGNINDDLNGYFGFKVSENLDDEDTYSLKEGMNEQSENYFTTKGCQTRVLPTL